MVFSVYWGKCLQAAGRDTTFRNEVSLACLIYCGKGSFHMVSVQVAVGTCHKLPPRSRLFQIFERFSGNL